jgi:signal transduction histidine kinase
VLRALAGSPHDSQPIFDTILDSARCLCQAEVGSLRLSEQAGLRLVAVKGNLPWSPPELLEHSSYVSQFAASRSPVHIPDQTAHELYRRGDPLTTVDVGGFRTALFVPMVKDEKVVGVLIVGRTCVQPFTDKQIELVTDFAAQAAIALQITRREREYREVQNELAHANRLATMGQLIASIAHELKQPLSAAVTNGYAGLRWLTRRPPEIEQARRSVEQMINDVGRASDVIDRIHSLVKGHAPRMEKLDINGAILEVVGLIQSEVVKNGITARMELAESLPHIQGDRVQLQQVILNLMINSIQAMSDLAGGERELHVTTELIASEGVRLAVRDSGPGALRREPATSVCTLLHYEAQRHGDGPIDLQVDHREPRRTAVGEPDRPPRCSVSVYDPSHSAGQIMIRSMSLYGTSVWTGRALQVGYDGLEIVGLAHLYSAL